MSLTQKITSNKFKQVYCDTICIDEKTQEKFIKLPVESYQDIEFLQNGVINAIDIIASSQEFNPSNQEIGNSIRYLCDVLKATQLTSECEGLTKLV